MSRLLIALSLVLLALPARAADLPVRSKIGKIFAEPETVVVVQKRSYTPGQFPVLSLPGYYGRPNSFMYSNYYGSSLIDIYGRLPYACGVYGYC